MYIPKAKLLEEKTGFIIYLLTFIRLASLVPLKTPTV